MVTWLACSPSSPTIQVRIPLKSTLFMQKMLLKKATTNKKMAELKKNDVMEPFLPCHCCLHNWKSTLF